MSVSAMSSLTQAQSSEQQAIQVTLERQANSMEASGALALLQALPQPQYNNPTNLGNGVDVQA